MNKFKIGDKVRCISSDGIDRLVIGKEYTVAGARYQFVVVNENPYNHFEKRFELVKENNMFDIKKDKWFIRTPTPEISEAVQLWLFQQGVTWQDDGKKVKFTSQKFLTNTQFREIARDYIMYSNTADNYAEKYKMKEIKFSFKTVVDTVEYPVVESEQDIKLRELKETIAKAQEQIDILFEIKK